MERRRTRPPATVSAFDEHASLRLSHLPMAAPRSSAPISNHNSGPRALCYPDNDVLQTAGIARTSTAPRPILPAGASGDEHSCLDGPRRDRRGQWLFATGPGHARHSPHLSHRSRRGREFHQYRSPPARGAGTRPDRALTRRCNLFQ